MKQIVSNKLTYKLKVNKLLIKTLLYRNLYCQFCEYTFFFFPSTGVLLSMNWYFCPQIFNFSKVLSESSHWIQPILIINYRKLSRYPKWTCKIWAIWGIWTWTIWTWTWVWSWSGDWSVPSFSPCKFLIIQLPYWNYRSLYCRLHC